MLARPLLLILGAAALFNGGAMLADPAQWYGAIPGVSETGPFNGHFVRDIGIGSVVAGAALLLAAWRPALWPAAATGAAFLALHGGLHVAELASGHSHGPFWFEIAAVIVPSVLAVYAAAITATRRT